jgi:predicted ArsR family transcriptional regulator
MMSVENTSRLGPLPSEDAGEALSSLSAQRRRVLTALESLERREPGDAVAISSVAAELGLHVNTAREHLDGLVATGLAHRSRLAPTGRGRPAWGYRAAAYRSGAAAEYVGLARVLAEHVSAQGGDIAQDMIKLGRRWGRVTAAAEAAPTAEPARSVGVTSPNDLVVRILDDLGFDPEPSRGDRTVTVRLRRCPMLEVAREHPDVVCQVHRGIVEGVLEAQDAPTEGVTLRAFAEPGACLLGLPAGGGEQAHTRAG